MGNSLGGRRSAKVMKINGETIKFKTPVQAGDVTKDYPGHVLLESESVKHYGIRAKPLEPWQELRSKRLYFIVELPKVQEARPRRARSGINMSAKDRLESLMLARRSVSDLTIFRPPPSLSDEAESRVQAEAGAGSGAGVRVKMRLSKTEVEKLIRESKDEAEVAEKIVGLCMGRGGGGYGGGVGGEMAEQRQRNVQWEAGDKGGALKPRQKRVGFSPIMEGEIQVAMAAS